MWKRLFIVIFSVIIFASCTNRKQEAVSVFKNIKNLTYSRNPDVQKWRALFQTIHTPGDQYQFVLSVGQTRLDTLFPLLNSIYEQTSDDSLRILCAFSMAQIDARRSTSFFMKRLKEDSLSPKLKKAFIENLGFSASPRSLSLLENFTRQKPFRAVAFSALAQLARQGKTDASFLDQCFDSTRIAPPSAAESYFLFYAPLRPEQTKRLIAWLPKARAQAQIYLLKKLASAKRTPGLAQVLADSATAYSLKTFLHDQLAHSPRSWHALLPELKLARYFRDSLFFQTVQKFTNDSLPAVRIEAFKTLLAINKSKALPFLVNQFTRLPFTHEKAEICRLITSADPATGYLLINQNLDKGNSYFKKTLLSALAQTKFPLAVRMLRQFLRVDDPVLVEGAYLALKQIRQLRNADIRQLLQSGRYETVALTLSDWYAGQQHPAPSKAVLLQLFKTFHKPNQFELQLTIASLLKKQGPLSAAEQDTIRHYVAHPYVAKALLKMLHIPYVPQAVPLDVLPAYLRPDSLQNSGHPLVIVKTAKGTFELEFFPKYAPLTVQNFLHLVRQKFYDHLPFHRVVADFVAQGGDPTGTGWGGPPYLIPSEHAPIPFKRGVVGMATAGFDTGGSQFFVCLSSQPHLNGRYTAFARVVKGMDTVDKLEEGDLILNIKQVR